MIKLSRRQFLQLAAGATVLPTMSQIAWAQTYPTRPVRIIVGTAAGGVADILARLMGQWLSERLGETFVIENRTGAGGNIGTETVVKSPPDGHTLLLVASSHAINATLYKQLNYNFIRDIAPVATIVRQPMVMLANPSIPATTIPEFIAYAKANPGKLNMASAGIGTPPHVAGELFEMMAGVNMTHVPYRGGGLAMSDLVAGQVQMMFLAPVASLEFIRAGKVRALAVTTVARSEALPDIPTVRDFVPGYEASAWFGFGAPMGTPAEIIEKLNKEINAGLADPKIKAGLAELGGGAFASSPTEFGRLIAEDTEKWAKVIKVAGLKAD